MCACDLHALLQLYIDFVSVMVSSIMLLHNSCFVCIHLRLDPINIPTILESKQLQRNRCIESINQLIERGKMRITNYLCSESVINARISFSRAYKTKRDKHVLQSCYPHLGDFVKLHASSTQCALLIQAIDKRNVAPKKDVPLLLPGTTFGCVSSSIYLIHCNISPFQMDRWQSDF